MFLKNLQFTLLQTSFSFWEKRLVFDEVQWDSSVQKSPDAAQVIDNLDALKFQEQIDEGGETLDQQIKEATDKPEQKKADLLNALSNVNLATGVEQGDLADVLDTIQVDFQNIESKIKYGKVFNALIEHLKMDLIDNRLDQDYDSLTDFEHVLSKPEKGRMIIGIQEALVEKQNIDWFGNVQFSEAVLNKLFNSVVKNKIDTNQSDGEFLKSQFENKNSAESKILMEGYKEIVSRLEVKQEEKSVIKELLVSCEEPYKRMADNDNLQNVISRRFDISKNDKGEFVLLDHTKPDEVIKKPVETIKVVLNKEFPEIAQLDSKEEQLPVDLLGKIKGKDLLQIDAIEDIKDKIEDTGEEDGKNFFEGLQEILGLIRDFFSGELNFDRVGGLMKGLKLNESKSDSNKFEMTYSSKDEPNEKEVFGYLEGKTLTVNKWGEKQNIIIKKPEQLGNIVVEDGKIGFEVELPEKKGDQNDKKLEGNWISTEWMSDTEDLSVRLKDFNEGKGYELWTIEGKDVTLLNTSGVEINDISYEGGAYYFSSDVFGKVKIELQKHNAAIGLPYEPVVTRVPLAYGTDLFDANIQVNYNKDTRTLALSKKESKNQ